MPVKLIASTVRDQGAAYSPQGDKIAFISDRSGSREIWISKADGSSQTRLTKFDGPQIDHLQWSPDGRGLAFESRTNGRAEIFTLDCSLGAMSCSTAKLLAAGTPAQAPSWSPDSKFIYFASDYTGHFELWKRPVSGGSSIQVTSHGGYISHESQDGKWLYFSNSVASKGIWRMPGSQSGASSSRGEELMIGPPYHPQTEGWAVSSNEIFFIDRATKDHPAEIRAYDIATKKVRTILTLTELFPDRSDIGVSVSPDSRWILYSQLDRSGSNVMVAENTH